MLYGALTAVAQNPGRLSREAIISQVLTNHPLINAADLEVSRQQQLKSALQEIPKADIMLMAGQYNSQRTDNNLTITQGVPFPTTFVRQQALGKSLIESARLQQKMTQNELLLRVKTVMNDLLYYEKQRQLLEQQDSLFQDLARIAALQYKVGEGTLLNKNFAETSLYEIRNLLARNASDYQATLAHLQALSQMPTLTGVAGSLDDVLPPDTSGVIQSPMLAFARQQIDVTRWEHKTTRARTLPDLHVGYFNQTLIGYQTINGQDQYFGSSHRFQGFIVGLSVPLFAGPHLAKIKAAGIANTVARKRAEAATLEITQEYTRALEEYRKNQQSLSYYRESALDAARLLVTQSKTSFRSGEIDYATLLINLRQGITIQENYLQTLRQYNQSIFVLQYLSGNQL